MTPFTKLLFGALSSVCVVSLVVACGSSDNSEFGDPDGPKFIGDDGSFGEASLDGGDLYANDPLPKFCALDGGGTLPPTPTGTDQCPSDKNKPGCGCDTVGQQAACWTGLRANRSLGVCKDGVTTCQQVSENTRAWGPCEGEVLPTPGAKGKAGCACFSEGRWAIKNLVPCFVTQGGSNLTYTYSSKLTDPATGAVTCNPIPQGNPPYPPLDPVWSPNTVKVDCAGHFKLCYAIKAGSYDTPNAADCTLTKVCTEGDYPKEDVETPFPDLPGWSSADTACAEKFKTTGGYGEMTVQGISILCDQVDDGSGNAYVFNRVKYCPATCLDNPSAPECKDCSSGGSGTF